LILIDNICIFRIFYESERGLSPNTEYVYDLELPLDFVPANQDGEVSEFHLYPVMVIVYTFIIDYLIVTFIFKFQFRL